jgi:hypothetical protein
MKISHFGGIAKCKTIEAVNAVLNKRYGNNANDFWISRDNSEYPILTLMVKDDCACVHYFPEDGNPGFVSIGSNVNLENDGATIFYVTDEEEMSVANNLVIPIKLAMGAANEFFDSPEQPKCIKWFNLAEEIYVS